jgi:programmed cell death protein 5
MSNNPMGPSGGTPQLRQPQQNPDPEQERRQQEARTNMLIQILDAGARERLSRICLVRPEKSKFIEDNLLAMVRSGQIRGKINEEQLISLLNEVSIQEEAVQPKITFSRRTYNNDDDEDEIYLPQQNISDEE